MKKADTYKKERIYSLPGIVARVFIPELTEEERARRMNAIHNEAANLLKRGEQG